MTYDPRSLYRALVLDHGTNPRNVGSLADPTHQATLDNPLCGDRIRVQLKVSGERLLELRFEARGCMIMQASASLMTETAARTTIDEAGDLVSRLRALLAAAPPPEDAGPLEPLRGVRSFPSRLTCATLPWDALEAALLPLRSPRA
ncbi:MAG: SUF system NifU family Fe-S cluster assembly protein [Myxococcales bacterium]|nr:SUF system NifU family Fe-S cluster assembly protein [Myxococcales bacterium]